METDRCVFVGWSAGQAEATGASEAAHAVFSQAGDGQPAVISDVQQR